MPELNFIEVSSGVSPVEKFLNKQSGRATAKILREIKFLEKFGLVKMTERKVVKKIYNNPSVYELKVLTDKIWYRFPFVVDGNFFTIIDCFKKDTNKIEQKDIERVVQRAKILLTKGKAAR